MVEHTSELDSEVYTTKVKTPPQLTYLKNWVAG